MKKTLLLIAMMLPAYAAHSSWPGIPDQRIPDQICCSPIDTVDYLFLAGKVALIALGLCIGLFIVLRKIRTSHVANQKSHAVILGSAAERGHTKYTQEKTVVFDVLIFEEIIRSLRIGGYHMIKFVNAPDSELIESLQSRLAESYSLPTTDIYKVAKFIASFAEPLPDEVMKMPGNLPSHRIQCALESVIKNASSLASNKTSDDVMFADAYRSLDDSDKADARRYLDALVLRSINKGTNRFVRKYSA